MNQAKVVSCRKSVVNEDERLEQRERERDIFVSRNQKLDSDTMTGLSYVYEKMTLITSIVIT